MSSFKDIKRTVVDQFERLYLASLLGRFSGNLSAAARSSGLSRRHLRELMRKHGLYHRLAAGTQADFDDDDAAQAPQSSALEAAAESMD